MFPSLTGTKGTTTKSTGKASTFKLPSIITQTVTNVSKASTSPRILKSWLWRHGQFQL